MASLYLVRHGQASFGSANYDSLSTLGHMQCRLLGDWWRQRHWKVLPLVSGPMQRHLQSMRAFQEGFAEAGDIAEHRVLPQLAEFDHENVLRVYRPEFSDMAAIAHYLVSTGNPRRAFQQIFTEAVERWHDGRFDADYNESWPKFRDRVVHGFGELRAEGKDQLVFTSGGVISVILQQVLGINDARSFALNAVIANSSLTRILFKDEEISLSTFNNTAHLDIHNAPELISYR